MKKINHLFSILFLLILFVLSGCCPECGDMSMTPSEPAPSPNSRLVAISGTMAITDDDWGFDGDDHLTVPFSNTSTVGSSSASELLRASGCVDEEVRIDINLTASLGPSNAIIVDGTIDLFESDECANDDKNGTTIVHFLVEPGVPQTKNLSVINSDEGGDHAEIVLTVTNFNP